MFWPLPLWLSVAAGLWTLVLGLLYYWLTCHFDFWRKKGVAFEKGYPLLGSIPSAMTLSEHMMVALDKIYKKHKGQRFVGIYQGRKPALLITDPDLIKAVVIKDFSHFYDHGFKIHEEADPLEAKNLFNLEGQKWKEMRSKLSPTFTSGKIKMMTPLMEEVAQVFVSHLTELAENKQEFEAKDLLSRFTTDVIGSCAFGIKCNSIQNPNSEFRVMGNKLVEIDFWRGIKAFTIMFLPEIGITFRFAFISKEVTNFFRKMVKDVMDMRKKSGQIRKDFMQLLIELKEKGHIAVHDAEEEKEIKEMSGHPHEPTQKSSNELNHDDLTAQATIFFLAGFDTSSSVMSFACLELAANPDLQRKAQLEIDEALANHNGVLTYEALNEMKYLECIVLETLRKYPPVGSMIRICTKNYVIPDTDLQIEEGMPILIPSYSIQNDPNFFPDPDAFLPERFSEDNPLQKQNILHMMPFGDGPRKCIGSRFAMVQSKMGLASILSKFDLAQSEKTKYPPQLDPMQFILAAAGGIWLQVQPRAEE